MRLYKILDFEGTVGFLQASRHWINMRTHYTIYKYFKCKAVSLCCSLCGFTLLIESVVWQVGTLNTAVMCSLGIFKREEMC